MKVTIDGAVYEAATAVALIEEIKGLHWKVDSTTDAEGYIRIQSEMYCRMVGRQMELPGQSSEKDTEARAIAMFKAVADTGAWEFEEEEGDTIEG